MIARLFHLSGGHCGHDIFGCGRAALREYRRPARAATRGRKAATPREKAPPREKAVRGLDPEAVIEAVRALDEDEGAPVAALERQTG